MVWVQSISPRPQVNNFSRDTVPLRCCNLQGKAASVQESEKVGTQEVIRFNFNCFKIILPRRVIMLPSETKCSQK